MSCPTWPRRPAPTRTPNATHCSTPSSPCWQWPPASAPVVLILDDLHWAAKPTLLLLRHVLRFGEHARVQIVGTYRSTDLDRSHPLAAMLADLHRDGTANRLSLSGLDEDDVTAYVAEAGYNDEELARALASVTGGNPFFLIEALRHVDESGGVGTRAPCHRGCARR